MNSRAFSLSPFPSPETPQDITIAGIVGRCENRFSITYALSGLLAGVVIPPPASAPERRDDLWKETCIEFFLATADSDRYWEFNLSPAGHWNVYRFSGYRQGIHEEPAFATLPFTVHAQQNILKLALDIGLEKIIPAQRTMKIGITAVIKKKTGVMTYWALSHPGPGPDFHHRNSFILDI